MIKTPHPAIVASADPVRVPSIGTGGEIRRFIAALDDIWLKRGGKGWTRI
ncbi:MAG: hypothetical protein IIC72_03500 [Acidobacteria bacterium]|nr:hypothetical protein [Acidobacteriota bacterium]